MLNAIVLILVGLIAASSYIVSKRPDAAVALDKIAPYQGWIGVVVGIWGLWNTLMAILSISLLAVAPLLWITILAVALVELALGFLLGYNLIVKYALSKNEGAAKKGAELQAKLVGYQTPLGLVAIALGIWALLIILL